MSVTNQAALLVEANTIKNETASNGNSASRVGTMLVNAIDTLYSVKATPADITAAINALKASVPVGGDNLNKLYLLILDLAASITPPIHKNYVDTAAMIADRAVFPQVEGFIYSVGTYPTIAYYEYLGTANDDITDYATISITDVPIKAGTSDIDLGTNNEKFVTPYLLNYQNSIKTANRVNADTAITKAGIYLCYGATPRTLTISDAIEGEVRIRTVATDDFVLAGNIDPNHIGSISVGQSEVVFIWSDDDGFYTY